MLRACLLSIVLILPLLLIDDITGQYHIFSQWKFMSTYTVWRYDTDTFPPRRNNGSSRGWAKYWPHFGYEPYWPNGDWLYKEKAKGRSVTGSPENTSKTTKACHTPCEPAFVKVGVVCVRKHTSNFFWDSTDESYMFQDVGEIKYKDAMYCITKSLFDDRYMQSMYWKTKSCYGYDIDDLSKIPFYFDIHYCDYIRALCGKSDGSVNTDQWNLVHIGPCIKSQTTELYRYPYTDRDFSDRWLDYKTTERNVNELYRETSTESPMVWSPTENLAVLFVTRYHQYMDRWKRLSSKMKEEERAHRMKKGDIKLTRPAKFDNYFIASPLRLIGSDMSYKLSPSETMALNAEIPLEIQYNTDDKRRC